ncbi:unnamed protein product, partial [Effrenium voratum]
ITEVDSISLSPADEYSFNCCGPNQHGALVVSTGSWQAVSPTRTVRGVAFRSTVEVEAKIDDVRSWQPEPEVVRWGSNEAQAAAPEPAERADADARTEVPSGSGGQGGSLREAAQVPQAPAPVPPSAAEAPLPP